MIETFEVASICPAPPAAPLLAMVIPAQFQEAIDRHQRHLIDLSSALRAAGVTPAMAADCVDAALASFRNGLMESIAQLDDAQ